VAVETLPEAPPAVMFASSLLHILGAFAVFGPGLRALGLPVYWYSQT
jgi:hypothetical protein